MKMTTGTGRPIGRTRALLRGFAVIVVTLPGMAGAGPDAGPDAARDPAPELSQPCAGKALAATCTATLGGRTFAGTCQRHRKDQLWCVANSNASVPGDGMFKVCEGKPEKSACSVPIDGKPTAGHCTKWNQRLVCRPGPWHRGP